MKLKGVWDVIAPGPSAVYKAATGPSDEAKATYSELKARWKKLFNWGIKDKAPDAHYHWESWEEFSEEWEGGDPDVTALAAQTADLEAAERYAEEKGYGKPPKPVVAPDIEDATAAYSAAATVDDAAAAVETSTADALNPFSPKGRYNVFGGWVPWQVWAGLAGAAALYVGGQLLARYIAAPRVTVTRGREESPRSREAHRRAARALRGDSTEREPESTRRLRKIWRR